MRSCEGRAQGGQLGNGLEVNRAVGSVVADGPANLGFLQYEGILMQAFRLRTKYRLAIYLP